MKQDLSDITDADVKKIMNKITWCEICGDGIGTQNYPEHLDYCTKRVYKNLIAKVDEIIRTYDAMRPDNRIAGQGIIYKLNEVKKLFEVMTK